MLHHVSDEVSYQSLRPYAISKNCFLRLLDYLQEKGYTTSTFQHLQKCSTKREVIITFDDCGRHLFDFAIPELIRRGMKACFYIPTAHINGINSWDVAEGKVAVELMNENDIQELLRLGMEIGSHSHHHIRLSEINEAHFIDEVKTSKNILESITQHLVLSFSYPFGGVPVTAKKTLSEAGYQYAVGIYTPFQNRYALRRSIYHDGDTAATLTQKLSPIYKIYRSLSDWRRKS
ncbi:MAG TPA: polysaccharide deacetylase family protein [Flavipsychrobacter sp.]|nr:polysaccharide deacetylase family protein [Flavipsychrobacter sp.]